MHHTWPIDEDNGTREGPGHLASVQTKPQTPTNVDDASSGSGHAGTTLQKRSAIRHTKQSVHGDWGRPERLCTSSGRYLKNANDVERGDADKESGELLQQRGLLLHGEIGEAWPCHLPPPHPSSSLHPLLCINPRPEETASPSPLAAALIRTLAAAHAEMTEEVSHRPTLCLCLKLATLEADKSAAAEYVEDSRIAVTPELSYRLISALKILFPKRPCLLCAGQCPPLASEQM